MYHSIKEVISRCQIISLSGTDVHTQSLIQITMTGVARDAGATPETHDQMLLMSCTESEGTYRA